MMPGVVCTATRVGRTARRELRLGTANRHPGVNSNLLNPTDLVDVPSNTHVRIVRELMPRRLPRLCP